MNLHFYELSHHIICLPYCTLVEPTNEGSEVNLEKAINVKTCKNLGSSTATVKHKIGLITSGEDTVLEELTTIAKNSAAKMGGDSIVAKEPMVDGVMSFDIYRCGE